MTKMIRKFSSGELSLFAAYESLKAQLPQNAAAKSRENSLQWLNQNGIATKRVEAYHYSDLRKQFTKDQNYRQTSNSVTIADILAHPTIKIFAESLNAYIIFVDGQLRLDLSDISKIASHIELQSLNQIVMDQALPDYLENEFAINDTQNYIDHLTRLMWRDGIVLNILKSLEDTVPLHMVFVDSGQTDHANFNRHSININANIEATLVETHINLSENPSLNLHHFNYKMAQDSKLTHFALNSENAAATNICRINGDYADNVNLNSKSLALGGAWSRREGDLACNGSDMDLKISGAVLGAAKQHIDNSYIVHHKLPNNVSFQHFKNVLDQKAHAIFQGKVIVAIDAQKTDGQQMAQTILLSDDAEINCKPELEIYADDVECAHGATVGALDEDMVFYLRARGIGLKQAQKLLIHAFVSEICDDLPEALNDASNQLVSNWLSQHLDD